MKQKNFAIPLLFIKYTLNFFFLFRTHSLIIFSFSQITVAKRMQLRNRRTRSTVSYKWKFERKPAKKVVKKVNLIIKKKSPNALDLKRCKVVLTRIDLDQFVKIGRKCNVVKSRTGSSGDKNDAFNFTYLLKKEVKN